jgi:uncharacterized protein YjiS (DUF1127 family)
MTQLTIARHPAQTYHPIQAAFAILRRVRRQLAVWSAQRRSRAQLLLLGDRELKDMGLSRAQAAFEHDKPFWRG